VRDERTQDQGRNYHNVNLPVTVPVLNVTLEDAAVAFGAAMTGLGVSSLATMILSTAAGVLVIILGLYCSCHLLWFANRRRKAEVQSRGYSRIGILRRYLPYWMGSDRLAGR